VYLKLHARPTIDHLETQFPGGRGVHRAIAASVTFEFSGGHFIDYRRKHSAGGSRLIAAGR
jgi:hypothetical protein